MNEQNRTTKSTKDYVYYNVRITDETSNDRRSNGLAVASFKENRVEAIIDNPEDYELAVERFKVPALDIPILIWRDNFYSITLAFDGLEIDQFLQFIPNHNPAEPDLYGDSIWNYQELIDSINDALSTAFTTLKAAKPAAPPTEAPFLTYDAATQLCTFNAEQLYDINGPPTIEVFFNQELYVLFPSFPSFNQQSLGNPAESHKIIIKDNKNNAAVIGGKNYFSTKQEYVTLSLWNDLASIVFETDTIPVEQELQPSQTNITKRIVTDFEPLEDINNREAFQYFPQGPLRFYDLKSKYPLTSIDIRVKWVDKFGNTYPIYLDNANAVTLKLLFRKKY